MTLGQKLQELRQENEVTQSQIAKELYVTRQTVSRWEQDQTLPSIETLNQIAHIYQTPLNTLVSDEDYNEQKNHKRINILALFGVILFNLIVGLAVFIVVISILFSFWVTLIAFILSPLVLYISTLSGLQSFALWQLISSVLLCILGAVLIPLLYQVTIKLVSLMKHYVSVNKKLIFSH
ncbi:helix-turn-helix domain-containing protein [Holzapfeliella sp. He02]|uniref:Helix-turn-helix domain-containing protein n=1 Tax=Holzapfeliella saturejae TaxID=3082953 RepID=A0ABU8SEZ3_9LACO